MRKLRVVVIEIHRGRARAEVGLGSSSMTDTGRRRATKIVRHRSRLVRAGAACPAKLAAARSCVALLEWLRIC